MKENINKYLEGLGKWKAELTLLRNIILQCDLVEEYKWMCPCYTHNKKNIVLIHDFKNYCAISFFKGALLKDSKNILIQPTENMQAGRQIRFTGLKEIYELESTIKQYIREAIQIEKSGLKVEIKKTSDYEIPEELKQKFKEDAGFEKAFKNLTPGRQKGYLLHFAQPKQSRTRTSRIEKNMNRISEGYGLRDCTCGLSKRKPNCDGSHKQLESVE